MKNVAAAVFSIFMFSGLLVVHPALAHTFTQDSDAQLLARIQEFKAESGLVASNISNNTLAQWHIAKSQQYWGGDQMAILDQKDQTLAGKITTSMDNLYSMAGQPGSNVGQASQAAVALGTLMDQAESEMVSQGSQTNATVQALALVGVLNETLKDYGTAIGSKVDLTDMNSMNMSAGGGMQGMQGMSSVPATPIMDTGSYQSAQKLAMTVQAMFGAMQSQAPQSAQTYLVKAGNAVNDLKQKIDSRASGMDVMTVAHLQIHPALISAFNIQAVPEFPVPLVLAVASFVAVVLVSRITSGKA